MNYRTYKIGEICAMVKGEYPTLKTPAGEYPLVVTAAYRRSSSTYQLEGPAVCIPLISSTGHGDAALHRVHYQEGKFALANLLVALLPKDPKLCDTKYLYHLLMAKKDEYFVPLMLGTANVSLKIKDIEGVTIPLPPLDEQHRVVQKIETLAGKIESTANLKQKIQTDARGILLGLFRKLMEGAEDRKMENVAPIERRRVEVQIDSNYPELGVRSFGRGTFHKPSLSGLEVGSKKLHRIEPGDVVFNNVFAWEGAVAVVQAKDADRFGSHRFITCVPEKGVVTASFLCFYFLTSEGLEKLGQASPGGAGRNRTLGLKALSNITVPVPSHEKQLWFDGLQAKIDSLKMLQDKTTTELDALMPSILSKAFKGEL